MEQRSGLHSVTQSHVVRQPVCHPSGVREEPSTAQGLAARLLKLFKGVVKWFVPVLLLWVKCGRCGMSHLRSWES